MTAATQNDGRAFIWLPDGQVPLNRPFAVTIWMCVAKGTPIELMRLDAMMPAHQHGMNYQPQLSQTDEHGFVADGLVFHMAGRWRITVSWREAGESRNTFIDLDVR